MSEYRDDLGAAHRRIAQLEEALGVRSGVPKPRRSRFPKVGWLIVLGGATFFTCVFGAVTGLFTLGARKVEPVVEIEPAPPELPLHASWYTQPAVSPAMVGDASAR